MQIINSWKRTVLRGRKNYETSIIKDFVRTYSLGKYSFKNYQQIKIKKWIPMFNNIKVIFIDWNKKHIRRKLRK